jgi:hypothetical protein
VNRVFSHNASQLVSGAPPLPHAQLRTESIPKGWPVELPLPDQLYIKAIAEGASIQTTTWPLKTLSVFWIRHLHLDGRLWEVTTDLRMHAIVGHLLVSSSPRQCERHSLNVNTTGGSLD